MTLIQYLIRSALVVGFFATVSTGVAGAQTLTIGIAHPMPEGSVLVGAAAVPMLVREATGAPLLDGDRRTPGEYGLRVSDRLVLSGDYRSWSLRIRPSAIHTDGSPVRAIDARVSLERCKSEGALSSVSEVRARIVGEGRLREEWIDLGVDLPAGEAREGVGAVMRELGRCQIFKAEAEELFGAAFGYGTNVVGPGYYVITDFVAGRSLRMARFEGGLPPPIAPAQILLRAFDDEGAGLTSLRAGGIDMLIDAGPDVLQRAERDETLAISRCSGITAVHRKDLVVPCEGHLAIARIHYSN